MSFGVGERHCNEGEVRTIFWSMKITLMHDYMSLLSVSQSLSQDWLAFLEDGVARQSGHFVALLAE